MASFYHNCFVFLVPFHRGNGTGGTLGSRCLIMPMLLFHLFRLFRTGGGTEQNKVDVFADRYVCSAAAIGEIGQPAAGLSPPDRSAPFPTNKRKAVARLLPAPSSGCLPLPFPPHTRSRQETRPGIPPGPPRGKESPGLRRDPLRRKC